MSPGEHVVIAHHREVVVIAMVVIDDHFGEVVAITPQRMGVRVALEEVLLLLGDNTAAQPSSAGDQTRKS